MHMEEDLGTQLQRWHELTRQETAALQARDWEAVHVCQSSKAQLRAQNPVGQGPPPTLSKANREMLAAIVAMELQNQEWLSRETQRSRRQKAEIDTQALTLRRVRQSYGRADSSHWQSYS